MNVTQIDTLVNEITKEVLGEGAITVENLKGVVDLGEQIFNANKVEQYTKTLVDKVGRMVMVDRPYQGFSAPVLMESWEYGSVLQKVAAELPMAQENADWQLTDGQDYSPNVFKKPTIYNKFYDTKNTFEIQLSTTEEQIRMAFNSGVEMQSFLSMLTTSVSNSMVLKTDSMVQRAINNYISELMISELGKTKPNYGSSTGRYINLFPLAVAAGIKLTKPEEITSNAEYIKFATQIIGTYTDRFRVYSKGFNVGQKARFTPMENQRLMLLSDFVKASEVQVMSGAFHQERVALPANFSVPFFQGSGPNYSFSDITAIDVASASGTSKTDGLVGVLFDKNAVAVCNRNQRTTSNYNPKAEFYNYFYKFDCSYYNDLNENLIVFVSNNTTPPT